MRFYANIWLLRLTLSLIIASTVIAADPDVWSFFGKNLRYQVGGGGCAPDKSIPGSPASKRDPEKLQKSYKEAYKLVDVAFADIDYVGTMPRPHFYQRKDKWRWNKTARILTSFFGIEMDAKNGGPPKKHELYFDFVKAIFEMMKNGMEANDPFHGLRIPALLCQDESIWKYFAPDDKIPELEGKTLKELDKPQGTAYRLAEKGGWRTTVLRTSPRWIHSVGSAKPNYVTMCQYEPKKGKNKPVAAVAWAGADLIVWCDETFTSQPDEIGPFIGSIKNLDTRLDNDALRARSVTWVHELSHFYGASVKFTGGAPDWYKNKYIDLTRAGQLAYTEVYIIDQPAFDGNGEELKEVRTYGTGLLMNLARVDPNRARLCADAYAEFALAA